MPSDIANQIVKQIFGDEKAAAIDSINDALGAASFDAIQARKLDFAKSMGFELDDTAQETADEIQDNLPDENEEPSTEENLANEDDETDS
jgi:hypothetical protein